MNTRPTLVGALVGAVAAGVWMSRTAGPIEAQQQSDFSWKGRLGQGKTIEIRNINGDVRADLAAGQDVEVVGTKTPGRRGYPEDVRIEVVEHADGATICVLYPARRGRPDNECRAGGGHNENDNNDTRVRFTVRVPAGVRFDGATVNGDVTAQGLKSDIGLHTVNGEIMGATTGYAEAATVNGSIHLTMGSAGWPRNLEYSTVNGGITLEVPGGIKADVEASTLNGDIESDFPLTVSGRFGPRKVSGTIAGGGPLLSMRTVNGSIELRRVP